MTAHAMPLRKFVIHTFLWLPPSFAAWYFSAPYLVAIAGKLARLMVNQFSSGVVSAIEQTGSVLLFVTTIKVHPTPEQTALLLPEVNALLYSYGLALFLALMLAEGARWWKFLVGVLILLLFQSWGIAFDLLMQLGIRLGPDVSTAAGLSGWRLEVIALGYQLGALIFPCLAPVVLWVAFSRLFSGGLSGQSGQNQGKHKMGEHQH